MSFGLSEERFEERKQDLINATNRLKEALKEEESELMIDAVLHRYEFTFELAWETLKDYLEYSGVAINTGSPREVIKESFAHNLISDGEVWIKMMLARNSLSHLYDEETSRQVYNEIKNEYINQIQKLIETLEKDK